VKESKWEGLAHPIEVDEEYNYGGDEEEVQEIHAEANAVDVGDSSMTEDCAETLQLIDTLQPTGVLQPTETPQPTCVVAVLTFRP
jgi:hypothetical protein